LSGEIDKTLRELQEQRDWLEQNGWIYSANGSDSSIGMALALSGRLKEATRCLEKAIAASDKYGNAYAATWNRIALAEIYLAIVSNSGGSSVRVLLANLRVIFVGKLFGVRRGIELLEDARKYKQIHERGVLRARIDMDIGLFMVRKQRFDGARERLLSARTAAQAQGVAPMVARIDAALAGLPASG
jgi:tetratricopeptide (TPR) repeat protein